MAKYQVSKEHYFRLHHIRPRFKNNVEGVLLFVATEISSSGPMKKTEFDSKLNKAIRRFPGNALAREKTINNWRTEISSLFGLILYDSETYTAQPSRIAQMLAERQDLVEFFKYFCYSFQYPGGHLKPHENKKIIEQNIKFKPAKYILKLLHHATQAGKKDFGINKAEAAHCIFNDLRVTAGSRGIEDVISLIEINRKENKKYDWSGDVIRYAGDILDYMYYANLLKKHGYMYYLNEVEMQAIMSFIQSEQWYDGYDQFYCAEFEVGDLKKAQNDWFNYLSGLIGRINFETDVLAYLGIDKTKYEILEKESMAAAIREFRERMGTEAELKTKEIGDVGVNLAYGHECIRLKNGGRKELVRKVMCIPDNLKMGFDIRSFELDADIRHIEVKATVSNSDLNFKTFHLTENEWNVASSMGDKYYVYRIMISRDSLKLFVIRNPIKKYKEGLLNIYLDDGPQVAFTDRTGYYEDLLVC